MMADCPICKETKCLEVTTKTEKIPYFGEVMQSNLLCQKCGYKFSDSICIDQKEPVMYSIDINKETLNTRVVKSQSATLSIPEIGLKVEPGPQSQGYVSNIEGVLDRFKKAVETALSWAEDDQTKENALKILEDVERVRKGEKSVLMVLEDPFGHSMILDEKADHRRLTEEEIKNLKTGFTTFETE